MTRAAEAAWLGAVLTGALADAVARGIGPSHVVFLGCSAAPLVVGRAAAAARLSESLVCALTAAAWLLAAAALLVTADADGALLAVWLALPLAMALAQGRSARAILETAGLTVLAVAALGLASAATWDGPGWSYGALPLVSLAGVGVVAALAAVRAADVGGRAATRRGALERRLEEVGEALAAAEREREAAEAAARDRARFFASMSHELRTPLNAILGFSDLMRSKLFGPLPAKYAEYADDIHDSARHLLDLVGDVLDVSRIEAGRYELEIARFDARDAVHAAARMIRPSAEAGKLELRVSAGDAPLEVDADLRALKQMILNLGSNAVKFTGPGGVVAIAARRERGDLVVEVTDTGVGLTREEIARIAQPFVQAREGRRHEARGSGLGLALVRSLCELHGGALEIESAPGRGSAFRLRLPVLAENGAEPEAGDARDRLQRVREAGFGRAATGAEDV